MQCSNIYILVFIPFALVGFALIIVMLKCNLTVSTGTLNGLIFYANIILRANHAVFFPLQKSGFLNSFRGMFVAWLNLDLGVVMSSTWRGVGDSVVFSSVGGGLHSQQGQGGGQEGRIVLHLGWADQWRVCGTGRWW